MIKERTNKRKFAILMRFPTPGLQYYPIPYYTSIFRGDWFDIKKLIGVGKKAKLKNHASVKYQVEVHKDYWYNICDEEHITDPLKMAERIKEEKENIKNFVAGIENSGKVWITGYYIDPNGNLFEEHEQQPVAQERRPRQIGDLETGTIRTAREEELAAEEARRKKEEEERLRQEEEERQAEEERKRKKENSIWNKTKKWLEGLASPEE